MGKISPVSAKYIIHAQIQIEGIVDRPDVIGAIFGQTEGLLGSELELRELQRSGRIGRIEVKLETRSGKTNGDITFPSSLDKTETVIVGASLETIQRIGPCNAKVKVESVEDVRISKRRYVIDRAKELLKELTEKVLPDSQEITEEVAHSVRMMEITEYGADRLPAGPAIDDSDEIIIVEGRADVLNLLKHSIKNAIAMNGTNVPQGIIDLCKKKVVTLFVDGDRGGDLIIKELSSTSEIDYVIKAPAGKEVEELAKKEIHKALRNKIAIEQIKMELPKEQQVNRIDRKPDIMRRPDVMRRRTRLPMKEHKLFKEMSDDLIGTRGAYILDEDSKILGKVPTSELPTTMRSLSSGVHAVILDGAITKEIVDVAEGVHVKYLIGQDLKVNPRETRVELLRNVEL